MSLIVMIKGQKVLFFVNELCKLLLRNILTAFYFKNFGSLFLKNFGLRVYIYYLQSSGGGNPFSRCTRKE